jgi:hypothetical protein
MAKKKSDSKAREEWKLGLIKGLSKRLINKAKEKRFKELDEKDWGAEFDKSSRGKALKREAEVRERQIATANTLLERVQTRRRVPTKSYPPPQPEKPRKRRVPSRSVPRLSDPPSSERRTVVDDLYGKLAKKQSALRLVEVSEKQTKKLAEENKKKEIIAEGILSIAKHQENTLTHVGIRSFLNVMRGEGLLGNSLEKSIKILFEWLLEYQKTKSILENESKEARKGVDIARLTILERKINTQIATIESILDKGEKVANLMYDNMRVFVADENKLLSLVRRSRKVAGASELVQVTRTAVSYFKREVLPMLKDLVSGYKETRKNVLKLITKLWYGLQKGKTVKGHEINVNKLNNDLQKYFLSMQKSINTILAKAERNLQIDEQEMQYIEIIENLAIKIANSSMLTSRAERESVRNSQVKQTYTARERLSIAKPTRPAKVWYKPWTWFK